MPKNVAACIARSTHAGKIGKVAFEWDGGKTSELLGHCVVEFISLSRAGWGEEKLAICGEHVVID